MKNALYDLLSQILSADKDVRQLAEQHLKSFESTEEYPVLLTEFIVQPDAALALRQLCCVLLKQYVQIHWSKEAEKFSPPEATITAKTMVKNLLPSGLRESLTRVRTGVAYAVAAIAHFDWPDAWPNLFNFLTELLTSGNADFVHGAMRVLTEFSHDITDKQIEYLAPILLPECLNIFVRTEAYSIRTRRRAVELFNTLSEIIHFVGDVDKNIQKRLLFPYIPKFQEAFLLSIKLADDGVISDLSLKAEIIKAVSNLFERFPKQCKQFAGQIMPEIFVLFKDTAQLYIKSEVNGEKDLNEALDSDGEVIGIDKLIYALFDFFNNIIDQKLFSQIIKAHINDIVYITLAFMQISDDKLEEWYASVEKYVEDEDEESSAITVRSACLDFLISLNDKWENETANALCLAVSKHIVESDGRIRDDPSWWKIQECSLQAMGTLSPSILNFCQGKPGDFDIDRFISTFVSRALQCTEHIILQGQALWFASRVCEKLSEDQIKGLLELCSKGLLAEQHQLMKCIAARSLYNCCDFIKSSGSPQIIEPFLRDVTENLIALGLKGGETLLSLALSTLSVISELCVSFDEVTCSKMLSLSNAAVLKYSGDPVIPSFSCSIVRNLSSKPQYSLLVQTKILPTLIGILRNEKNAVLPIRLQAVSLEVLEAMVQGTETPLSVTLVKQAFPVVAQCVLTTDDTHTLQAGRECIRSFVSKSADQVLGLVDNSGNVVGIGLLVQVICRLLEPSMPELSASMVGRLIFVLLRKADRALAPHLEGILNAVLNKMQHSELPAVHQSLIMVFAHLIHYDLESVVKFLSSVVMPGNSSTAMEFVFKIWCDKQRIFLGDYDQKISALALCKIMQYVLTKGDPVLTKATIDEEFFEEKNETGYSLRSRSRNKTVRKVPLIVKIFKLILAELDSLTESPEKNVNDEDSDTDTDTEDLNVSSRSSNFGRKDDLANVLSSLVNDLDESSDDDEEEDDPDVKSDPKSQINLKSELYAFVSEFLRQPFYQEFKQYLSSSDLNCLQKANVA